MVSYLILIKIQKIFIFFCILGGEGGAGAGAGAGHPGHGGAKSSGGKGPTIEEVD